MRALIAQTLIAAVTLGLAPVHVLAAATLANAPRHVIQGTATDAGSMPLACGQVRLRDLDTGTVVDTMGVEADGAFAFSAAAGSSYLVEALDEAGRVLGSRLAPEGTTPVHLTTASQGCQTAAFGGSAVVAPQAPQAQQPGGGWSGLGAGAKTAIILGIAAGAGVVTWAIVRDDASPSQ